MQRLNSGFNKFKMDDSIYVKMLIVQEMWKLQNIELYIFWCIIVSIRCNFWVMVLIY